MSHSATIKRAWNNNHLLSVLIELTYACNLDCEFCYNDLDLQGDPLSVEQYLELLDGLHALGTLHVALSGGEPLAHPNFFEIGSHARRRGFVVRIKSNGHAMGKETAERVKRDIDPLMVEVSLHGATASVHEKQTRRPGSFSRLISNIGAMKTAGLRVKVNSTLTAYNEHELKDMFDLCDGLGVRLQVDPEVSVRDDGDREPLQISASSRALARYKAILAERALASTTTPDPRPPLEQRRDLFEGTGKHCGAGSSNIAVDPFGNVLPCVQWRMPVGNLHTQSIQDIWRGASGLDEARRVTERAAQMVASHGEHGPLMNFCPGAAHAHHGDPLALYPAAKTRKEQAARERVRLVVL